jgi:hypothetical protein
MADINIIFNDHGLANTLTTAMRQRLPKAMAYSLNKVARIAQADLKAAETVDLHTNTKNKFIQSSTQYEAARSAQGANMAAEVGILSRVWFMERLVEGGVRHPNGGAHNVAVPIEAQQTSSGRIKASQKPSAIRGKSFIATIGGVKGIWMRKNGDLHLMYALKPETVYDEQPYLDFDKIIERSVAGVNFPHEVEQAIRRALGLL